MNAHDYLKTLQAASPLTVGTSVPGEVAGLPSTPVLPPTTQTPDFISDRLEEIGPTLPEPLKTMWAEHRIAAGLVGDLSVDARCERVPNDSWAIIVPLGFSRLIYYAARALANVAVSGGQTPVSPTQVHKAAVDLAETAWWFRLLAEIHAPGSKATPAVIQFAFPLSQLADLFYVCHELGHVWIDTTDGIGVAKPASVQPPLPSPPTFTVRHRKEYLADGFALRLLAQAILKPNVTWATPGLVLAAAILTVEIFSLLEHLGFPAGLNHPRSQDRVKYLEEVAAAIGLTDLTHAQLVKSVFTAVEHEFDAAALSPGEEREVDALQQWLTDELLVSLSSVPASAIPGMASVSFPTVRPDLLLIAVARAVLREVSDPNERVAEHGELIAQLSETHTDAEIQEIIDRQEVLIRFVHEYMSGGNRDAFVRALSRSVSHLRAAR